MNREPPLLRLDPKEADALAEHKITTEVYPEGIHVHLDNCSINIIRTDEGVVVDIWEPDFEGTECVATTYAFDSELIPEENEA